jgi:hypothetical protein
MTIKGIPCISVNRCSRSLCLGIRCRNFSTISAMSEFNGSGEDRVREICTREVVESLKNICHLAVNERLDLFTRFYG